jgi:hypothetical protein
MSKTRDRVGWNRKIGLPLALGDEIEKIAAAWTLSEQEVLRQALRRGYALSEHGFDWTPGPLASILTPGAALTWYKVLYLDDEWGEKVERFAAGNELDIAEAVRMLIVKGLPALTTPEVAIPA